MSKTSCPDMHKKYRNTVKKIKFIFLINDSFVSIETLDGRDINELTRQFLINWKASKEANRRRTNNQMLARTRVAGN